MANEVTLKVKEAQKLDLSERQIYRLRKRIQQEGSQGMVHGNRGRPPSHTNSLSRTGRRRGFFSFRTGSD